MFERPTLPRRRSTSGKVVLRLNLKKGNHKDRLTVSTGHDLDNLEEGRDRLIVSAAMLKAGQPRRFARVWKESKAKRLLKEIGRLARQFLGRGAPAC